MIILYLVHVMVGVGLGTLVGIVGVDDGAELGAAVGSKDASRTQTWCNVV